MPVKQYVIDGTHTGPLGTQWTGPIIDYYNDSTNTIDFSGQRGKVLKPLPHKLECDILKQYYVSRNDDTTLATLSPPVFASRNRNDRRPPVQYAVDMGSLNNSVLGKFNGKLRFGGTSLGITIAQWPQANFTLLSRFEKLNRILFGVEQRLERNLRTKSGRRRFKRDRALGLNPRYTRRTRDPLANQVLEYEFGWKPLVQDIVGTATTLITHAIPDEYVRSSTKGYVDCDFISYSDTKNLIRDKYLGYAMVTIAGRVRIENPNLWLANRAGLINLPGIVWDAIPWSFLVGMFVNVNQILGQLSNEAGLTITDRSTTVTEKYNHWTYVSARTNIDKAYTTTTKRMQFRSKVRTVGSFPSVSLRFRSPELNPELIAIAASLAVQRFTKISKLLDLTYVATRSR